MKVDFFGDDLGLKMYTFTECDYKDVANYMIENYQSFSGNYKVTRIDSSRKYWLFGELKVVILLETEKAIKMYGGGEIPKYQIFMT